MISISSRRAVWRLGMAVACTAAILSGAVVAAAPTEALTLPAPTLALPVPVLHPLYIPTSTTYTLPDGVAPFAPGSAPVYPNYYLEGSVTVTALNGANPTPGFVELNVDGSEVCGGTAPLSCDLELAAGTHEVQVSYSGSGALLGSSTTYTVNVLQIPTTTVLDGCLSDWAFVPSWYAATVSADYPHPIDQYELENNNASLSSQGGTMEAQWGPSGNWFSVALEPGEAGSLITTADLVTWAGTRPTVTFEGDSMYAPSTTTSWTTVPAGALWCGA